jgi:hypothetical protein
MRKLLGYILNWIDTPDAPAADEYEALLAQCRRNNFAAIRRA